MKNNFLQDQYLYSRILNYYVFNNSLRDSSSKNVANDYDWLTASRLRTQSRGSQPIMIQACDNVIPSELYSALGPLAHRQDKSLSISLFFTLDAR